MLYISDSDENIARQQPARVNWEHYSPAASSNSSLGSSVLVISSQALSLQSGGWSAAGSSGWPSLLNIASTASLLSSYTPPAQHDSALTPIDDVDELSDAAIAGLLQSCGSDSQASDDSEDDTASPFGRKALEQRPRVGPMDIDHNDNDSSWLNASTTANAADSTDEPSRKRRFLGTQQQTHSDNNSSEQRQPPVLTSAPFVFSMPPAMPTEPMAIDWEAGANAVRNGDSHPVSPNAARRIQVRRRNHASTAESQREPSATSEQRFSRLHESPMVGDQRFTRRRMRRQQRIRQQQQQQQQQQQPRRRHLGRSDGSGSPWTTDSEGSSEQSDVDDGRRMVDDSPARRSDNRGRSNSDHSRQTAEAATPGSQSRRGARGRRSARSRREWRMSQGVDRMLAMMGSKVDEPTTLERLQMYRDLPYVISGYLQLGFNIFMVATVLVIMVHVLLTIQRDVNAKVQEYSAEILHEIAGCSKQYLDNRCDPLMRVPAMEQACQAWDNCMHRDPTKVGRARVSAETLAEIINGFIEPISLKTMLFFVIMFLGTLFISNFAFGAYRHSRVHHQYVSQSGGNPGASDPGSPPPPTTHYRSFMPGRPRCDDPMATPTPKSATMAHPLAPSSAMSSSLARRDHSAHSIYRRRSPYR
ncbi:hypothetical protein H4R24_004846 [Coemansia sp. RSA 988]|nr:hypothetical protein H4R24_004846 [Coemansia sp. RSA 988]